jgi:hypothetical protein
MLCSSKIQLASLSLNSLKKGRCPLLVVSRCGTPLSSQCEPLMTLVSNSKDSLPLPHCGLLNCHGRYCPGNSSVGPNDSSRSLLRLQCGQLFWSDLKCRVCQPLLTSSCARTIILLFYFNCKSCSSCRWTGLSPFATLHLTFARSLSFSWLSLVPWLESHQWILGCWGIIKDLYCLSELSGSEHDRWGLLMQINGCQYQRSRPPHQAKRRH